MTQYLQRAGSSSQPGPDDVSAGRRRNQFVFITETQGPDSLNGFSARVHVAGLNKGGMDTFVDNLPGFPDNIRPSSTGGYWVAMSAVRPNPGFSMLDFLSQRPWIKKLIFKVKNSSDSHKLPRDRQQWHNVSQTELCLTWMFSSSVRNVFSPTS